MFLNYSSCRFGFRSTIQLKNIYGTQQGLLVGSVHSILQSNWFFFFFFLSILFDRDQLIRETF